MKKSILFLILVSFLNADNYSDIAKNRSEFKSLLEKKTIPERKDICLEVMNNNKETNPIVAFHAANCLLYNGYGKLAIPLFTKYIYTGYNKKYFNGRIGYGWMHSADWYNVGDVLTNITNGEPLFSWVSKKINEELIKNPIKYGVDPLSLKASLFVSEYLKKNPFSKEEITILSKCKKIKVNIEGLSCDFIKKKYVNCIEKKLSKSKVFECID